MKKKIFVEDKERLYLDDIFEDIAPDEAINKLIQFCDKFKEKQDCKFIIDDWCRDVEIYLTYKRVETDEEYEKRLKKEKYAKEKQVLAKKKREESERRQYEKLKKKFEGNN